MCALARDGARGGGASSPRRNTTPTTTRRRSDWRERDDDDARRDQSRRRAWVDVCRVRMYRSHDERSGVDETIGRLRHPGVVMSCDWNASGSVVATTCEDGVVRLWSANLKDGTWCEHAVAE